MAFAFRASHGNVFPRDSEKGSNNPPVLPPIRESDHSGPGISHRCRSVERERRSNVDTFITACCSNGERGLVGMDIPDLDVKVCAVWP